MRRKKGGWLSLALAEKLFISLIPWSSKQENFPGEDDL
jgi:hypothetical protein